MCKANNLGPEMEPWGTPQGMGAGEEESTFVRKTEIILWDCIRIGFFNNRMYYYTLKEIAICDYVLYVECPWLSI